MKNLLKVVGVLALLAALGFGYFYGVHRPIEDKITALKVETDNVNNEITSERNKLARVQKMVDTIEAGKASGTRVVGFDSRNEEIEYLNSVVDMTNNFTMSFSQPQTSSDGYARRAISFSFEAENYTRARQIIDELNNSPYRTFLTSYSLRTIDSKNGVYEGLSPDSDSRVNVSITLIFIESTKLKKGN